jgi:uncharacterized protein
MLRASLYNITIQGETHSIVWNTKSRALRAFPNNSFILSLIQSKSALRDELQHLATNDSNEHLEILTSKVQGFLVDDKEYYREQNRQVEVHMQPENILNIVITTTLGCNFNCSYCCQGTEKVFEFIPEVTITRIIEIINASTLNKVKITWYGGEPLLNPNLVIEASQKIKEHIEHQGRVYMGEMYTNGYLLTSRLATKLANAGINHFQISIDGSRSTHDASRMLRNGSPSYDQIMDNINQNWEVNANTISYTFRINLSSECSEIKRVVSDLIASGADRWEFARFYLAPIEKRMGTNDENGETLDNLERFADIYTEFLDLADSNAVKAVMPHFNQGICTATRKNSLIVTPNGEIHKCWDTVTTPSESVAKITESTKSIVSKIVVNKWTDFDATLNINCSKCRLLPVCGGNCAVKHYDNYREMEGFHAGCPPLKFLLGEYLIRRLEELCTSLPYSKDNFAGARKVPLTQLQITSDHAK